MMISVFDGEEYILGKRQNAGNQHLILFLCFLDPVRIFKSPDSTVKS